MQSNGKGTMILVLGILGLICCPICGPVAWVMGNGAMNASTDPSDRNLVNIGRILGMVGTALTVLGVIVWTIIIVLSIVGGAASGGAAGGNFAPR